MDELSNLDLPGIDHQDVLQEAELLRLQGKIPNLRIIRKRLSRGVLIYDQPPEDAQPFQESSYDPEVTDALIDWALQQTEKIQERIFLFLEEPKHEAVPSLLIFLRRQNIPLNLVDSAPTGSLSKLLMRTLQKPQTLETLYEIARSSHTAERPEAAVRQFIRRAKKEGKILEEQGLLRRSK